MKLTNTLAVAIHATLLGGLTAGLVNVANAQDVAPDAGISPKGNIEEVVVAARRREETVLSIPVAITALTSDAIERTKADDLSKIGELVPSVIVGSYKLNGGGSVAIRGISTSANQAGFEQAASVAIDGVQSSDGRTAQLGFFDLAQVEVLKGPQALYFGKNSVGGVISLQTADPTPDLEMKAEVGYEFNAAEKVAESSISGPLSDRWGARLALRYKDMRGWMHNDAGPLTSPFYNPATGAPAASALYPGAASRYASEEEMLGRVTLTYDGDDDFLARFKFSFADASDNGGAGTATQNIGPCSGGDRPRMYGVQDPYGNCRIDDHGASGAVPQVIARTFKLIDTDGTPEGQLDARTFSMQLSKGFGSLDLDALSGYNYLKYGYFSGGDQTSLTQLALYEAQATESFSQEVRLSSSFASPVNFLVGGFYQRTDIETDTEIKLNDGQYNAAVNRWVAYQGYSRQNGETWSAFGQLTWDITDTLELSGGARWTKEEKSMRRGNQYGFGPFNISNVMFAGSDERGVMKGEFSGTNVSPEVTLSWRPHSNRTYYVAFKQGYKSGGFGLTSPLQVTTQLGDIDFDSEDAKGFEGGIKGTYLDRRLSVSSSVFAYQFTDLQVNTYDPERVAFTVNNAGELNQYGVDLETTFSVTEQLTLHSALAYVHNRFDDFTGQCYSYTFPTGSTRATAVPPPNCSFVNGTSLALQQVYDGRAPARSPDLTGNAGFVYDVPLGSVILGFNGDVFYSDSYFASEAMSKASLQPSFWRFNAGINLRDADDRWNASLVSRNLTNEFYLIYAADRTGGAGVPGQFGEQRGVVSRGREILLRFSYKVH